MKCFANTKAGNPCKKNVAMTILVDGQIRRLCQQHYDMVQDGNAPEFHKGEPQHNMQAPAIQGQLLTTPDTKGLKAVKKARKVIDGVIVPGTSCARCGKEMKKFPYWYICSDEECNNDKRTINEIRGITATENKEKGKMKEAFMDLWEMPAEVIIITTNGFVKKNGRLVMGRGCAQEARDTFTDIDLIFGKKVAERGNNCYRVVLDNFTLVNMPVKHNWWEPADLALIIESCHALVRGADKFGWTDVRLPRPGCGNGQLNWENDVKPVIETILDDRFTVVTFPPKETTPMAKSLATGTGHRDTHGASPEIRKTLEFIFKGLVEQYGTRGVFGGAAGADMDYAASALKVDMPYELYLPAGYEDNYFSPGTDLRRRFDAMYNRASNIVRIGNLPFNWKNNFARNEAMIKATLNSEFPFFFAVSDEDPRTVITHNKRGGTNHAIRTMHRLGVKQIYWIDPATPSIFEIVRF